MDAMRSAERSACPCCGYLTLPGGDDAEYEICPVCFWQHDIVDEADPDRPPLGPNRVSLAEARRNFAEFGACERKWVGRVRSPRAGEVP
jgi:cysteine-rich CPCC protein